MRHSSWLGVILLFTGCTDTVLPTTMGDGSVRPTPYDGSTKPGTGGTWRLPALTGQLPTFVNLDWSKFPQDRGPHYTSTGKVWVVKPTGQSGAEGSETSPLRSIAEASSRAGAGDLIRVYAGSYEEPRGVTLGSDNVVLTAAPGAEGQVTLVTPNNKGNGILITARTGVVVNGINLKGCTTCMAMGLEDTTQRNIVISNLRIDAGDGDFPDGIVANANTVSKGFPTLEGLLIKNVEINDAGLSISCGAGLCSSWRLENVRIKGAIAGAWGSDGIAVEKGDNILLYGVEVYNVTSDGIDLKATRVVVWGCHVHHVQNNGLKLWHGGDIVNTLITDLHDDASIVGEGNDGVGDRMRILHTTIANQPGGGYGIAIGYDSQPSMQVEIINSIYYGASGAAYIDSNCSLEIKNSIFFGSSNGELLKWGNKEVYQASGKFSCCGSGNLIADPLFDGSYHLKAGSPGLDQGLQLTSAYPTTDATGQPRVQGSAPEIGAFEN